MLEPMNNLNLNDQVKIDDNKKPSLQHSQPTNPTERSQQHPLHQYDLTIMSKFYESCVGKMKEQMPKWQPTEWIQSQPMPQHLSWEQKNEWSNPMVISQKQKVYEAFARLARETGEPMILMPNFDYGDIINFERFLQALKQDGVNAIGKYKQYLNNKDMRKFEVDLVAIHPRYGVLLVEVKDCDHLDNKRRSRARVQLNHARSCFESMGRLIIEAKGWAMNEAQIPVTEIIAVPNVQERQMTNQSQQQQPLLQTQNENPNQSATSTSSKSGRQSRVLQYLIKSDLETQQEFTKWWTRTIVEPIIQRKQQQDQEGKPNKFDSSLMNWMLGLINCIRNNSIMPVVYPETDAEANGLYQQQQQQQQQQPDQPEPTSESSLLAHQPALNVHGEFLTSAHESVRSTLKCMLVSRDSEKIRKAICLQTLWLMLNDSQKKISVLCSEMNKQYYEEFFARQRKLYNNFHNVRFYTDLQSCAVNAQNTLKKDNEIWFFDSAINGSLSDVMERVKNLNAFWVFTTQEEALNQYRSELQSLNVRSVSLDERSHVQETKETPMPWLSGKSIKLPLRLQSDLLIIGDIIGTNQLRQLYRHLKSTVVTNQSSHYQNTQSHSHHYNQYPQQQHLNFNPAKKFKSVKFIRGGTIDNLRNSLKMHDSIQSQVILLHVGDEDLFKTRHSVTTIERIKELATLVKEYCPKSFVVISTLMRRMSRTENGVTSEVNKGITNFCKQTRDTLNCYYMLNNHFEPDYHTQEGRILNNKGLKLYVDNLLFCVDYFLVKNNKQH